jgi:hypothetical protein
MTDNDTMELFLALSSVLTGFDLLADPWQQDVAEDYLRSFEDNAPKGGPEQILGAFATCRRDATGGGGAVDAGELKGLVATRIMAGEPPLPALAQSIIWLWYLSAWYYEPEIGAWPEIYAENPTPSRLPQGSIVKGQAYTRGLGFVVGQAHPPGYTQTVYGSWSSPPPAQSNDPGGES